MSRDQSEEDLRNIVAKTISSVDADGDGKVSFLEFQQVCALACDRSEK